MNRYFTKGLSDEGINYITTFNHSITTQLSYSNKKRVEFNKSYLKQDKVHLTVELVEM